MITKIGNYFNNHSNSNLVQFNNVNKNKKNNNGTNPIVKNINWSYYPVFTGTKKSEPEHDKLKSILFNADPTFKNTYSKIQLEAQKYGYPEITTELVYKYLLDETLQYTKDIESGKKDFKMDNMPNLAENMIADSCADLFSEKEKRTKILPVLEKHAAILDESLKSESPNIKTDKLPELSEDLKDFVWMSKNEKTNMINSYAFSDAVLNSKDYMEKDIYEDFWLDLCDAMMINKNSMEERSPFDSYANKAQEALKNISLGTNVFVTYDFAKEQPQSFLDTIHKYNKDYKIIEFNKYTQTDYFLEIMDKISKDKKNKYIVMADPGEIMTNSPDLNSDGSGVSLDLNDAAKFIAKILKSPDNVRFLLYDTKNNYFANSSAYTSYEELQIPVLTVEQKMKEFRENPNLYKEVESVFSKPALNKIVSASEQMDGVFPKKAIELMKKISVYNSNKKEITEKDVDEYLKNVNYMFKKNNDENAVEVVFNTGKTLKDMVGKEITKNEALSLVKQIKTNKLSTKGIILYSEDGSSGSGRKFTAKAIAGEAQIPYVEINSMDFGTEKLNLFGADSLPPDKSMKKLFSVITNHAETNKYKSVLLYIENFEYLALGEEISPYFQSAMAQLLREMDKAEKAGLNLVIIGSVSTSKLIGPVAAKSFKFTDTIPVSTPAYNRSDREDVLRAEIKQIKLKLEGDEDNKNEMISYMSDLTKGFPLLYIKKLIHKAKSVASERNHKTLTKADITEAYLQLTTGRPTADIKNEHEKRIVTSHECGHATNLTVMNNVAKTLGKEWHIPDKVNFVTLDPRGIYCGAVFDTNDNNREISFEKMFADVVYGFGGHSCEKHFYGIDGSYGITCDMEMARNDAMDMVRRMGMGAKTGKMTILDGENPSDKTKEMLESDERVILHNAKIVSDLITEIYSDFNKQFTKEYSPLVGTGNCLIDGNEFRHRLGEWKSSQSPEKQKELEDCDRVIVEIMEATKRGIEVIKNS